MTTYTTGPWSYKPLPGDTQGQNRVYWVDANGSPIADVFNTGKSAKYNAALIAAAPDLLEALIALVDQTWEQFPHFESERGQENIAQALAAIEKAKPRG
jgi:hypothetical protein